MAWYSMPKTPKCERPMQSYVQFWKDAFVFRGRTGLAEGIQFLSTTLYIAIGLYILDLALGTHPPQMRRGVFLTLYGLALIIPSISLAVRRLHDSGRSGWFVLVGLIPYLGQLLFLFIFFLQGTEGANQYGPDPQQQHVSNESDPEDLA